MSFAHDGVRQNISMSDMIKYLTTNSSPSATSGGLLGMNEVFGVPQYSEFNAQHDTGGLYSVRNAHTGLRGGSSSGSFSTENKLTFSSVYGRYRSGSTGTPSNQTIPTVTLDTATANSHGSATNIGFDKLVGYSDCVLTTDPCGQTRGAKGGVTSNVVTLNPGYFGIQLDGSSVGRKPGQKGNLSNITHSDLGFSVYGTYHNNQWTELGLNTITAAGDRVVVVAHAGAGGTMNTFTTTDPIYLRSQTGASLSGVTTTTLASPHKNETGSDDWMAVYMATAPAGAARVGVNPYHSGLSPYLFYVMVIKGPYVLPTIGNQTTKYTTPESAITVTNANAANFHPSNAAGNHRHQGFIISISSSAFWSNGHPSALGSIPSTYGYDMHMQTPTSSYRGAYYVSICNYTGGYNGTTVSSKYGYSTSYSAKGYTPQVGRKMPNGDGRHVWIRGYRKD